MSRILNRGSNVNNGRLQESMAAEATGWICDRAQSNPGMIE
jgi:hypothetical protein